MELHQVIAQSQALIQRGELDHAIRLCQETLSAKGNILQQAPHEEIGEICGILGDIFKSKEKLNHAIGYYLAALRLNPRKEENWMHFTDAIKLAQFQIYNAELEKAIIECLNHTFICHQHLAIPGLSVLKLQPYFQSLLSCIANGHESNIQLGILSPSHIELLTHPLLLLLLQKTIIPDVLFERLMTSLRGSILKLIVNGQLASVVPLASFISALALQCSMNEYVYIISQEEFIEIEQLAEVIKLNTLSANNLGIVLAIYGCYKPISQVYTLKKALELVNQINNPYFSSLIHYQIKRAQEETAFSQRIVSTIPITNALSLQVQAQYEENPYPRWESMHHSISKPFSQALQDMLPCLVDTISISDQPYILIAGCGTGQHAIRCAERYQGSKILAVDLSLKSLLYAQQKAEEYQVSNIEFMQADILNLDIWDKQFDVIECSGVLHHMEDPVKGLSILTKRLKTSGIMTIGLYSRIGRRDILEARAWIKENHYRANTDDIRECRQKLIAESKHNPLIYQAIQSLDFYSLSGCRDLLFHVQESQFDLLQIEQVLSVMHLELLGIEVNDRSILNKYLKQFSEDVSATSLKKWNQFELENPETFIGMYHLWVRKLDQEIKR